MKTKNHLTHLLMLMSHFIHGPYLSAFQFLLFPPAEAIFLLVVYMITFFSFFFFVSINVSHFVMKPLFGLGRSIHLCAFLLVAYIVFVLINLKERDHLIPVFKLKSG